MATSNSIYSVGVFDIRLEIAFEIWRIDIGRVEKHSPLIIGSIPLWQLLHPNCSLTMVKREVDVLTNISMHIGVFVCVYMYIYVANTKSINVPEPMTGNWSEWVDFCALINAIWFFFSFFFFNYLFPYFWIPFISL